MAEGLLKELGGDQIEVYSAGSHPSGFIHPKTIQVMKEIGIDISDQHSKSLDEVPLKEMNYVVTLCDSAANYCPTVPEGKIKLHWPFDDPGNVIGNEARVLDAYRLTRDLIRKKIREWFKESSPT